MNDTPPSNLPADAGQLLDILRALSRELRPGAEGIERLGLEHALERDFGLDSLARVELLTRIERELGARLPEAAFALAETPRDLLHLLAGAVEGEAIAPTPPEATPERGIEAPPADVATLTGLLDWHAARHGEQVHITLLGEDEHAEDIRFSRLRGEALALAAGLLEKGLGANARVALMLPTGREFFVAFYGTLYAGCVPVPLYPPTRPSQLEDHMRRIAEIVDNAGAAVLITDHRAKLLGHLLRALAPNLRGVETVADLVRPDALPSLPTLHADDIAFLQYTSGSTGNPKGVVLSHANLRANLRAMEQATGVTARDVFVSWLPLYHDMGLIGACLGSLAIGFRLVLMSPLAFLARPARWLQTLHRWRGTVSAAPNFAYELCANKLDDRDLVGLDLSCWRLAYNGAEPVSAVTLERFAARFAPFGFRREAMTPVYGLAECSVGLAFPPLGRGPLIDRVERRALATLSIARIAPAADAQALAVVCCGRALPGHAIRVVDGDNRELPERHQGRVQFRGPSATRGYYRNPEASARLFDPSGDWLNSGDLGYLAAGELYLTGREKDIIIRAGHNLHPQELEAAVGRLPGVRRGGVAVFPASDPRAGTERLVVLAETREESPEARARLVAEINRLTVELIGLPADDIVLAPPRSVLKTSSGKVRRAACRERYERGELGVPPAGRAPWRQALRLALSGIKASLRRLLGTAAGWVWSVWAWTVFAGAVAVFWPLIVAAPTLALRRRVARAGARLGLVLTGLWPRVEGLDNLQGRHDLHPQGVRRIRKAAEPPTTPLILVANHASYLDALILTAVLPPRFAYVAKQELLRRPFAGIPLRRLGAAFVARFDGARGVEDTRALEARVQRGDAMIFFAEGTFRTQPGLLPFRMGAFVVAANTGTTVAPLTLTGTRALLPDDTWRPCYSRIKVWLDVPIEADGADWSAALKLRDAARDRVLAHLDEPDAAP